MKSSGSFPQRALATARGCFATLALTANVLFFCVLMVPFSLVKLLVPYRPVRRVIDRALNTIAMTWIGVNNAWIAAVGNERWDATGADGLRRDDWYLIAANHQSWVDILVLQNVFSGRVPMLKFFLKRQLIYVPVIGLAWWALDFPEGRHDRPGRAVPVPPRDPGGDASLCRSPVPALVFIHVAHAAQRRLADGEQVRLPHGGTPTRRPRRVPLPRESVRGLRPSAVSRWWARPSRSVGRCSMSMAAGSRSRLPGTTTRP